jgi:hypothetical protein
VDATYDATPKKMTWTTTDSGLTGPATTAHFSGPAELGKSAPPVVAISGNLVSPINREAILADAQAFELQGKAVGGTSMSTRRPTRAGKFADSL